MHSSLKLGAFGYALSPISKKYHSFLFKKEREINCFKKKNEGLSSIKVSKLGVFGRVSFK